MGDERAPTRKNLMEVEEKIEFYEQGKNTLEQKRDALVFEFMDLLDEAKGLRDDVEDAYENADNKLAMTRAQEGDVAVRGAAAARKEGIEIVSDSTNIMGVVIPTFEAPSSRREIDERGYGIIGSSARMDETAEAYESLIDKIVRLAEVETAIRRLLEEIEETNRRVNALEVQLIPDLEEEKDRIEQALMEQEREEVFRMKKIKEKSEEDDDSSLP